MTVIFRKNRKFPSSQEQIFDKIGLSKDKMMRTFFFHVMFSQLFFTNFSLSFCLISWIVWVSCVCTLFRFLCVEFSRIMKHVMFSQLFVISSNRQPSNLFNYRLSINDSCFSFWILHFDDYNYETRL